MLQRLFLCTLLCLTLSACSYIKKHVVVGSQDGAYKKAVATAPIKLPAGMSNSKIGSETESLPSNVEAHVFDQPLAPPGSLAANSTAAHT
jgi:hypothetical protein